MRDLHPDYGARSRLGFVLASLLIAIVILGFVAILCLAMVRAQPVASSEVHVIDGDIPILPRMPLVLGHENAGVVASIGADVRTVKAGDAVAVFGG